MILLSETCPAKHRHERRASPSIITVQQPHVPRSHPRFTPKVPTCSLNTSSKIALEGISSSTDFPLTSADQISFGAWGVIGTYSVPTTLLTHQDVNKDAYQYRD